MKTALNEQNSLKLPWFKNVEPLLKLDEIYHPDHVTAFHTIKKFQSGCTRSDEYENIRSGHLSVAKKNWEISGVKHY